MVSLVIRSSSSWDATTLEGVFGVDNDDDDVFASKLVPLVLCVEVLDVRDDVLDCGREKPRGGWMASTTGGEKTGISFRINIILSGS